jgi:hypothetical protein
VVERRVDESEYIEYYLEYSYLAQAPFISQRMLRGKEQVSRYLYDHTQVGDWIEIRYLSALPWVARITGNHYRRNFYTAFFCWWTTCHSLLILLAVIFLLPAQGAAYRRVLAAFVAAGLVFMGMVLLGWVAELIVESLSLRAPLSGGGLGLIAGLLVGAATFALVFASSRRARSDGQ